MNNEWTDPEERRTHNRPKGRNDLGRAEFNRRRVVLCRVIIQNAHRLGWDPHKVAYAIAEGFLIPTPSVLDWDDNRPSGPIEWVNCDPTFVQEGDKPHGFACQPSRLFKLWWWLRCIPDKIRHYFWVRRQG